MIFSLTIYTLIVISLFPTYDEEELGYKVLRYGKKQGREVKIDPRYAADIKENSGVCCSQSVKPNLKLFSFPI